MLVSFALSQSHRNTITQFAHRSLNNENPIRAMLALSLLLTCLYSGDEVLIVYVINISND